MRLSITWKKSAFRFWIIKKKKKKEKITVSIALNKKLNPLAPPHCVKCAQIRSFFWSVFFFAFRLNTKR